MLLKRELESVRRELRNFKIGQHENKRETTTGEMFLDEKIAHERTGHATYDPRCEACLKVRGVSTHPRKAVAEAASSITQQSRTVNEVQKSRSWSVLDRAGKRLREPCIAKEHNSKILNCF